MTAERERRRAGRTGPDTAGWRSEAVLRPGVPVRVVDICAFGVLVECPTRLRPGRVADLQLVSADTDRKHTISGRIERCHVIRLQPLGFRGAIAFDGALRSPL